MAAAQGAAQSVALAQLSTDAPSYTAHRPLDADRHEIRILDIHDDFSFRLRHASLDERPVYRALSYYWGAPGVTRQITIDGEHVQIRKTLFKFLRCLYRRYGRLSVWLDVLCINQRDVREQNSQVQMMGDIYRQAECVYAWLGQGDADSDYALGYLSCSDDHKSAYDEEKVMHYLGLLFQRPFWYRVWTVQECVLNNELLLVCGNLVVQWTVLSETIERLWVGPSRSSLAYTDEDDPAWLRWDRFKNINHLRAMEARPLLLLMRMYKDAQCLDPRDKVYGFRALAADGHLIQVDYTQPTFNVFLRALSIYNARRMPFTKRDVEGESISSSMGVLTAGAQSHDLRLVDVDGLLGFGAVMAPCIPMQDLGITENLSNCENDDLIAPLRMGMGGITGRDWNEFGALYKELRESSSLYAAVQDWWRVPGKETPDIVRYRLTNQYLYGVFLDINKGTGHIKQATLIDSRSANAKSQWEVCYTERYSVSGFSRLAIANKELDQKFMDALQRLQESLRRQDLFRETLKERIWPCRASTAVHLDRSAFFILLALRRLSYGYHLPDSLVDHARRFPPPPVRQCNCPPLGPEYAPPWQEHLIATA